MEQVNQAILCLSLLNGGGNGNLEAWNGQLIPLANLQGDSWNGSSLGLKVLQISNSQNAMIALLYNLPDSKPEINGMKAATNPANDSLVGGFQTFNQGVFGKTFGSMILPSDVAAAQFSNGDVQALKSLIQGYRDQFNIL